MNVLLKKLSQTDFIRSAIEEKSDLSEFKKRPTLRVIIGVSAILLSYVICWPLISVLGMASVYLKKPLLIAIGGPVAYGMSHAVFIFGMWISGAYYTKVFLKWAGRVLVEKFMPEIERELL
jgi:hypothetical protein